MGHASQLLPAGTPAPDFALHTTPDQLVSLSDFRGRPVILAFYPADWSPVCGDQMALYNEVLDEFQKFQAQLLGISVDGVWCHAAFAGKNKLRFPLLADFEPKGAVARAYGVYDQKDGVCERALFVINADGSGEHPLVTGPDADLSPAWSPDGSRIAFASGASGSTDLFTVKADGSDRRAAEGGARGPGRRIPKERCVEGRG